MTTASGHTSAILASRVKGTAVFNTQGEKIGHVEDIMLDKTSNEIMFAVVGFGGFLGIGEKFHTLPWNTLDYNAETGGYIVQMSRSDLEGAPVYDLNDLTKNDGSVKIQAAEYYGGL